MEEGEVVMTMIETGEVDWSTASDSMVYFAAADGIQAAIEEQRRRELERRTTPNQSE
jgi:hypothetical protein